MSTFTRMSLTSPVRACRVLVMVLAVALLCACSERSQDAKAANFVRVDFDNQRIELAQLRGKVVLVNFWASWCPPCLKEIPAFVQWQHEFGAREFQVIGISMDDSPAPARAMVTKLRVNYPVIMGDEELAKAYGGILGLPTSFLIDRDGRIVARFQGVNLPTLRTYIADLLAGHAGRLCQEPFCNENSTPGKSTD